MFACTLACLLLVKSKTAAGRGDFPSSTELKYALCWLAREIGKVKPLDLGFDFSLKLLKHIKARAVNGAILMHIL